MTDISKQLAQRPSLQRRVFSFNHRSPSELVRSKLSTAEIQYRALTYLPDELLSNIPETDNSYSLFQGFQATLPEEPRGRERHNRKGSGRQKLIEGSNGSDAGSPSSLGNLNREKSALARQLEMLGIRKNMASSEIREIDMKIANLSQMRHIVLDRLAKLEQDEAEAEHESKISLLPLQITYQNSYSSSSPTAVSYSCTTNIGP